MEAGDWRGGRERARFLEWRARAAIVELREREQRGLRRRRPQRRPHVQDRGWRDWGD